MISFKHSGNFKNTERFLNAAKDLKFESILRRYGQEGVAALANATPVDTGEAASSWNFRVIQKPKYYSLEWTNSSMAGSVPVVILLQYGHANRDGSYLQGVDFINPAIKPVFDKIAEELWREVTRL